jgi:prepilin-type N-terminal cleavage/methylation domain-containing protein
METTRIHRRRDQRGVRCARRVRGLSLVEMVISIALIGLLAVMATPLLRLPLTAWNEASRRAELVQAAEQVNRSLAADLQRALPGSVRVRQVGARTLVEMLDVRAQGRYRSGAGGANRCPVVCGDAPLRDALKIAPGCNDGCFMGLGAIEADPADPPQAGDWVVVLGDPPADPYLGGNAAIAGGPKVRLVGVAAFAEGSRVQHAAHRFGSGSPAARYYVVAGAVSWEFDAAAGIVRRHASYPLAAVQPAAFGGATSSVTVAQGLTSATLRMQPAALLGGGTLLARARFERTGPGGGGAERFELVSQYLLPEPR